MQYILKNVESETVKLQTPAHIFTINIIMAFKIKDKNILKLIFIPDGYNMQFSGNSMEIYYPEMVSVSDKLTCSHHIPWQCPSQCLTRMRPADKFLQIYIPGISFSHLMTNTATIEVPHYMCDCQLLAYCQRKQANWENDLSLRTMILKSFK